MGKAIIISNKGKGLYEIKVLYEIKILKSRRMVVDKGIVDKTKIEVDLKEEILLLKQQLQGTEDSQNSILNSGNEGVINGFQNEINRLRKDIQDKELNLVNVQSELIALKTELVILKKAFKLYVDNPPELAWCIEFKEDLTGNVDTIELSDENNRPNDQPILISPIPLQNSRSLTPSISTSTFLFGYMFIATPVHQIHRPEYRHGIIVAIDYVQQTTTVNLLNKKTAIRNKGKQYPLNKKDFLNDVPVDYLSCDILAFSKNDHVVVEFLRNPETPKIIGFIEEPFDCSLSGFIYDDSTGTRLLRTNKNTFTKLEPSLTMIMSGQLYWSGENNFITFNESGEVYSSGLEVYNNSIDIAGCCIIDDVLFILSTSFGRNTPGNLFYRFHDLNTDSITGSGFLIGFEKIQQPKIPINEDGTKATVIMLPSGSTSSGQVSSDILTISIDFENTDATITDSFKNEAPTTVFFSSEASGSQPSGFQYARDENGIEIIGDRFLIFAVDYFKNILLYAKKKTDFSRNISITTTTNTPGVPGTTVVATKTVKKIHTVYDINGNIEEYNLNVSGEVTQPGGLTHTASGVSDPQYEKIIVLDLRYNIYYVEKRENEAFIEGVGSILLSPRSLIKELVIGNKRFLL